MATNCLQLILIYVSVCVLMSTGLIKVKYLNVCGPPDKTLKYKITPWPVLTPGQSVTATVTFTPAVNIYSSTLTYELTSKKYHQVILRGTLDASCNVVPQFCDLAGNETHTLSFNNIKIRDLPAGVKGTFTIWVEFYNQDQDMWGCVEAEFVI